MAIHADSFQFVFLNTSVNSSNYQEFGVECLLNTFSPNKEVALAQMIAYIDAVGNLVMADNTYLSTVRYSVYGTTTSVELPFPTAEYQAVNAAVPGTIRARPNGYADKVGKNGAGMAPLGTSISVTELTAIAGPSGRGRHFLPFINSDCVSSSGELVAGIRSSIFLHWDKFFNTDAGVIEKLEQKLLRANKTLIEPVVSVKAQPIFSNLRSRRR